MFRGSRGFYLPDPGLVKRRGLQKAPAPLNVGKTGGYLVDDGEGRFEPLRHLKPLKSLLHISSPRDNCRLSNIAVPIGDTGKDDDLAFLGGLNVPEIRPRLNEKGRSLLRAARLASDQRKPSEFSRHLWLKGGRSPAYSRAGQRGPEKAF